MRNSLKVATAGVALLLSAAAWAQVTKPPPKGVAPRAQTFQVVCTMGTASVKGIQAGACGLDAENDGGGGGDPAQDNDGPGGSDLAGNGNFNGDSNTMSDTNNAVNDPNTGETGSCGNSPQQTANCYPDPNGPAHGNPPTGGGGSTSGTVSSGNSAAWLAGCTKQYAAAEAACKKTPNSATCLSAAKASDTTCIMAASNNAQQRGGRLSPDASPTAVLSQADCASVHTTNTQYCGSVNPAVKASCVSKSAVADQMCTAAVRR